MPGQTDSTLPSFPIPSVVIIAPAADMLDLWLEILQQMKEVPSIQLTTLADAATAVARWRPLALLFDQELFAFDAKEFDALGRDVGAQVIAVDARAGKDAIVATVLPQLEAALTRWRIREGLE
ncbi:MAG TPA: hypothetical protein VHE30_29090 [Polyangiaceae bacterium]|nr:hypothetical protein [Polyangiaceae bacterium]